MTIPDEGMPEAYAWPRPVRMAVSIDARHPNGQTRFKGNTTTFEVVKISSFDMNVINDALRRFVTL